jgi:ankyrin repeat protein
MAHLEKLMSFVRHNKNEELCACLDDPDERVNIDRVDKNGNTLLMVATQNHNKRIVKSLLRRGASATIRNLHGDTALHHAFGLSYDELGNYLIAKGGADDTILNSEGLTCYEMHK